MPPTSGDGECVSPPTEAFPGPGRSGGHRPRYRSSTHDCQFCRSLACLADKRLIAPLLASALIRIIRVLTSTSWITALSRCFVLIVALSIFAVTLPVRAEVPQPTRHRMSCCAHMAGERGHCGGSEPVKSQDRAMLPGLHGWAFVVFGLNRGFLFFIRTRRKTYRRDRRLIITVRPSSCSTAARLIVCSRRLAHA